MSFLREDNVERFSVDSIEVIDSSLALFYHFDKFLYNITKERNIFTDGEDDFSANDNVVEFSKDILSPYKFSRHTIKYYKLNRRFSEVSYVSGRKKEQMLNVTYSQNLAKGWNAGGDFRRAGAEGFFRRQQFYQSSFDVFTHYETPNGRYNLFAYYLRNHLEQQENGGIKDFDPKDNTVAQPTYLSAAENKQTDKEFLLRQSYDWNKTISDTNKFFTTAKWQIGHEIRFRNFGKLYSESSIDSFYQNNFLNQSVTNDSVWYQRWNNKFFVQWDGFLKAAKQPKIKTSFAIASGYDYLDYKLDSIQLYNEGMLSQKRNRYSECSIVFSRADFKISAYARNSFVDNENNNLPRNNNYSMKVGFRGEGSNMGAILYFEEELEKSRQNIIDRFYYSNHFIWFNQFPSEEVNRYSVGISDIGRRYFLSGEWSNAKNYFYNTESAVPAYYDKTFNYYSVMAQGNLKWRSWHLDNKIIWQKSENDNVLHLPEWRTGHSLYIEKLFFKKALIARIGTDVTYTSSYYADRYNPALQQFYLQGVTKTGGYALVDLYVNFRVKASLFFIKAENLFSGLSDTAYFYRPDYPVTPRVIRFGLQFRFFD